MTAPAASPEEAAAVTAAIERFLAETAPAPTAAAPAVNPWQQAALREGVGAKRAPVSAWGDAPWAS